jgi:hypothetical protein
MFAVPLRKKRAMGLKGASFGGNCWVAVLEALLRVKSYTALYEPPDRMEETPELYRRV